MSDVGRRRVPSAPAAAVAVRKEKKSFSFENVGNSGAGSILRCYEGRLVSVWGSVPDLVHAYEKIRVLEGQSPELEEEAMPTLKGCWCAHTKTGVPGVLLRKGISRGRLNVT